MKTPPPFEPLGARAERIFEFRYTVFTVTARLDDRRIEVRAGVRTSAATLERLQHLHVHTDPERGVEELLLSYAAPGGRLRRIRVFADVGEPGFARLVDALVDARPDVDIRHLDRRQAWDRTGSRELDRWVLPGMMAVAIAGLAIVFAPRLMHGFDGPRITIAAADLARGDRPPTRHLLVEGRAVVDEALFADQDPDRITEPTTAWLPLVGPEWRSGAPVGVVLEVRNRTRGDILAVGEAEQFSGLLRDIAWEGLEGRRRAAFEKKGVRLTPDVALIEYGASPGADVAIALGVVGLLSVMMLGVMLALRRRARAAARGVKRAPLNRPRGPGLDEDDEP